MNRIVALSVSLFLSCTDVAVPAGDVADTGPLPDVPASDVVARDTPVTPGSCPPSGEPRNEVGFVSPDAEFYSCEDHRMVSLRDTCESRATHFYTWSWACPGCRNGVREGGSLNVEHEAFEDDGLRTIFLMRSLPSGSPDDTPEEDCQQWHEQFAQTSPGIELWLDLPERSGSVLDLDRNGKHLVLGQGNQVAFRGSNVFTLDGRETSRIIAELLGVPQP